MIRSILSERMRHVHPSFTKAMTARAAELRAAGRNVITLSQGELDFETPQHIRAAAIRAIEQGRTRYTAVAGIEPLREVITDSLSRDLGLHYTRDQITVGCGAKQVIFNALLATLDAEDEVIVPVPCWVSYPEMVRLAGGRPVLVSCDERDGFKIDAQRLERAITPRTKWLILNSPCNPTGAVYSREELLALAELLRRFENVWILSDDIYEKLTYAPARFTSLLHVAPDLMSRCLIVNGVSKTNAMTGWRVGYGASTPELIKPMNAIQGQTISHTSSVSQYAALEALAGDRAHVQEFLRHLTRRRALMLQGLNGCPGLRCAAPDGAFYVFVDCSGIIGRKTADGGTLQTDVDVTLWLMEAGVAGVPGQAFLASPYVRFSFAASDEDLLEATRRIRAACESLE